MSGFTNIPNESLKQGVITSVNLERNQDGNMEIYSHIHPDYPEVYIMCIDDNNYAEVPFVEQEDVSYLYAVKHKTKKIEIRYQIYSVSYLKDLTMSLEEFYPQFTFTVALNLAGNPTGVLNTSPFKPDEVKNEFGAGVGSVMSLKSGSNFGKGYEFIMVVGIAKNDAAIAYIFYLCDDVELLMTEMAPVFYNLKFN